ncbi:unnamed protein product [Rotaria socialis]|uniref:Uncharacterized protein n=2 Tax=Rotaria socialis TaxID=392032 RepID=A0A818GVA2_9BILA|nr:unnamed protein product [Rotaria socialis]CAF4139664.1 unnamed protein product [Rotaria socialis]
MHQISLWQFLCIVFIYRLNVGLTLSNSSHGTSFTRWTEDDWLETNFFIQAKFMFNRQRYENIILRTRMAEWSLELSYGDKNNLNKLWTELHLFLDRRYHSMSFNDSISDHVRHTCRPPILSPLTNDSAVSIPELAEIDKRIAQYFVNDGFFRTINYIHCTIDERRHNPSLHIQMDIYLVTNREFRSLIYIEISNTTRQSFADYQAKFYLHNYEKNFKYNFNASSIMYPLQSNASFAYMIKLYNPSTRASSGTIIISSNMIVTVFNFFLISIFFCS